MAARVIAVAQQKGGTGKTTLLAHLALHWIKKGQRVAILDIDPQRSISTWWALRQDRQRTKAKTEPLSVEDVTGWRVPAAVDRLRSRADIILIDCPARAETDSRTAIRAANLVLVPVQPGPMDIWATEPTLAAAKAEGRSVLLVFNRVPARTRLAEEILKTVHETWGMDLAPSTIGNRIVFGSAMHQGRTAVEVEPSGAATQEIAALADHIQIFL